MTDRRRYHHENRGNYRQYRYTFLLTFSVAALLCMAMTAGGFTARAQESGETFYKYYTSIRIMPEDTLWTLADTYCDASFHSREAFVKEVARINHLLDEKIVEGDWLIVPYYSTEFK